MESGNKRKIEERFLEVRVLLDQGDAESLFTAIASLHEAIMGSPESQEAQVLKTEIDHRLQEQCRRPISLWLMKNKLVGLCLRKFKEFQTLERLAANLCFDQIAPLESERSALLVALFQVAMESFDASVLENYLRALEPRLEPQAVTPNLGKGAIN